MRILQINVNYIQLKLIRDFLSTDTFIILTGCKNEKNCVWVHRHCTLNHDVKYLSQYY
jgi:hypothetical protein